MNPGELQQIEAERQALLGQLAAIEAALRTGLMTEGFGTTVRAHLARARSHIQEACIGIQESKPIRSVPQLVDDLNRVQQVMDDARRHRSSHSQRI